MTNRARAQAECKTESLFRLFVRRTSAGCWEWLGKRNRRTGYGELERKYQGRRYVLAHRLAYAVLVGPIPEQSMCESEAFRAGTVRGELEAER